ncbi:MAG: hypothetical protein WKF77_28460 [Planctomycetaceae bacterium]
MNMETETIEQNPERTLYGKLLGIVQNRHQLKALCESFATPGACDIEVLDGLSGIAQLEKWKDDVSQYFFGDMEGEMLQRYLDAVKNNLIVFAAPMESEMANSAAEIAKTHGASEVTHFGNSVITNY